MSARSALLKAALGSDASRYAAREGREWDDLRAYADAVQSADAESVLRGELPTPIPEPQQAEPLPVEFADLVGWALVPPALLALLVGAVVLLISMGAPSEAMSWWRPALFGAGALVLGFLVWFPKAAQLARRRAQARPSCADALAAQRAKRRVWEFRQRACAQMSEGVAPSAYLDAIGASGIDVRELR